MKKKLIIILCAVLAVLIAGGCIGYSFLPHPLNYPINKIEPAGKATPNLITKDDDSVTLQKGDAAPFRILAFLCFPRNKRKGTDPRFGGRLPARAQNRKSRELPPGRLQLYRTGIRALRYRKDL